MTHNPIKRFVDSVIDTGTQIRDDSAIFEQLLDFVQLGGLLVLEGFCMCSSFLETKLEDCTLDHTFTRALSTI
ncbi:hypothetical protein RIF29_19680 [Crotalaria pallida]|uniref:Uncharacterized protein n=1 Tax=Crotalaria pallida TaxID=3830 RepID=A0AAN9F2W6_CROPI